MTRRSRPLAGRRLPSAEPCWRSCVDTDSSSGLLLLPGQEGGDAGVVQRALQQIFKHVALQQASGSATHDLTVQYIEIYNKHIK